MKIKSLLFLLMLFQIFPSRSQPLIQWQNSFGGTADDYGLSIVNSPDGGYMLGARTKSNDGDVSGNHGNGTSDYWAVKLDSLGNIDWQKCLGGSNSDASTMIISLDNGYLFGGFSNSINGDVLNHHGSDTASDVWLVKIDLAGNIVWSNSYGGTNDEIINSVIQTNDDGFLIAAQTRSIDSNITGYHNAGNENYDIWIFKIDSMGNLLWNKCFGSTTSEYAGHIIQSADGGYYLSCEITGGHDGDVLNNSDTAAGARSVWVVKLDSSLAIQWQRILGGSLKEYVSEQILTADGGIILGCSTESNDGDVSGNHAVGLRDSWIVKLDSTGNIEWQKCYGGENSDNVRDFTNDHNGGYVVISTTASHSGDITNYRGAIDIWLFKIDDSGNLIWQSCFGGSNVEGNGHIELNADSGYIFTGISQSNDIDVSGHHGSVSFNDCWVAKLSSPLTAVNEIVNNISDFNVYPNPVISYLETDFTLKFSAKIEISILDIRGEVVKKIYFDSMNAGNHNIKMEINDKDKNISPGLYFLELKSDSFRNYRKILITG